MQDAKWRNGGVDYAYCCWTGQTAPGQRMQGDPSETGCLWHAGPYNGTSYSGNDLQQGEGKSSIDSEWILPFLPRQRIK